jgi:adenine deaminase
MVAVGAGGSDALSLECAGLMSSLPCETVVERLHVLQDRVAACGGGGDAFMHLSFLPLTVIPSLRLTDRGLFDGIAWIDVPLFTETDQSSSSR